MSSQAEALVAFAGNPDPQALAILKNKSGIHFEVRPGTVRILATGQATPMAAMKAAAMAALSLIETLKSDSAMIESVKIVQDAKPARNFVSQGSLSKGAPRPQTLMDAVSAPRPQPDNQREAFRNFMTSHRLRPTTWAKDAGISSGEILGFLSGSSRGFSAETAQKLARAAKVRVEDMFR